MNIEPIQERTLAALEWARAHRKSKYERDVHAVNQNVMAHLLNQILESINLEEIKSKVGQNPKEFFELARTLLEQNSESTKRMKVELELKAYRDQVAEQKRQLKETLSKPDNQKGLSPEVLQQIEEAMAKL